jgi:hypothetical protein
MSSVDRQNKLIAAEDWKRIYQSFKNADFQSYDFDNLRRTMITYLRENYPEDFNDYIESSEYLALIDLIAFLGQNLAFRFDLNARDNFLELAERRESVLRLARLLSYNAKRNLPANGLLKFTSITTTESVIDSNGRDLSNKTVVWNDPANNNWYEQFIKILNAALPETSQFGKPQDANTINGIYTEQYRFNATNTEVPVYGFTKNIDGRNMPFEVVSCSFRNSNKIYEEAPFPGNSLAFLYRDDGGGAPSSNTGFFAHFRQGTLQESTFGIARPSTNETVDIDSTNVNNDDVWLYSLDSVGIESTAWTKVSSLEGNNIIYNSLSKNIRKIFSVLTRTGDRIRLVFPDGTFGDLPQGRFKAYYRTSNGLTYSINPTDIRNVTVDIPYVSKSGKAETLTIALGLRYTVNNASAAETSDSIKQNAPATYYTQNRMITGEDYNVLPLSINQEIIKIKSVNRVSSGISRYFDLKDTSGKYSHTNLFGIDGIIYKQPLLDKFSFTFNTRSDIESAIVNQVEPLLLLRTVKDFYIDKYPPVSLSIAFASFQQVTKATNISTGYAGDIDTGTVKKIGPFTTSSLKYLVPGALVKFIPPAGKVFTENNAIVDDVTPRPLGSKKYIWAKVVRVSGDGTANGRGILDNGQGALVFNEVIPTGAIFDRVVPKFTTAITDPIKSRMIDLIFASKTFALRYDINDSAWKIISDANIDKKSPFSIGKTGDLSNQNQDASWTILLESVGTTYNVSYRGLRYVFESEREVRFFFDSSDKVYDSSTGKIIKDKITVLSVNTQPNSIVPFSQDFDWEIVNEYQGADGYIDTKKISISFFDSDEDGVVDDPDRFIEIAGNDDPLDIERLVPLDQQFIYQQRRLGLDGVTDYFYIENNGLIIPYSRQQDISVSSLTNGQLVYIVDQDLVKTFNAASATFTTNTEYRAFRGRAGLKFQYIHAADSSARIDPAATNIVDVYMLTKSYDTDYRRWLKNEVATRPLPLSSDALFVNFGQSLNDVKSISDEIIYHPVKYKNLFGPKSDSSLQATFKVVKNDSLVISDNDIKVGVVEAINQFFSIENWDFGDTFYFGELATYIMNKMTPNIVNIVIVPRLSNLSFGSLYEIKSNADELFVSSATVDDVEIISEITATKIKASGTVLTSTSQTTGNITSA